MRTRRGGKSFSFAIEAEKEAPQLTDSIIPFNALLKTVFPKLFSITESARYSGSPAPVMSLIYSAKKARLNINTMFPATGSFSIALSVFRRKDESILRM